MSGGQLECPFCGSAEVELVSLWGGQLITSQLRCRSCSTHFEAVRDELPEGLQAPEGPESAGLRAAGETPVDHPPAPWTTS